MGRKAARATIALLVMIGIGALVVSASVRAATLDTAGRSLATAVATAARADVGAGETGAAHLVRIHHRPRHWRRHRHFHRGHVGPVIVAPLLPPAVLPAPAAPPPPPAWRFDGVRWVCDFYSPDGRPLCR